MRVKLKKCISFKSYRSSDLMAESKRVTQRKDSMESNFSIKSEDVQADVVFRGTEDSFYSTRHSQTKTQRSSAERTVDTKYETYMLGTEDDVKTIRPNNGNSTKSSTKPPMNPPKNVCIHEINLKLSKP